MSALRKYHSLTWKVLQDILPSSFLQDSLNLGFNLGNREFGHTQGNWKKFGLRFFCGLMSSFTTLLI